MWNSLVKIIDRSWREKRHPRRRFAKAVMALHSSLENCHNCFLDYKENSSEGNLKKWKQSIDILIKTISSIEPILKIFQSNLWAVLSWYCWGEFFMQDARLANDMIRSNRFLVEELRSQLTAIDLLTHHDYKAKYDQSEPKHKFGDPLDESRQRLLRIYFHYLKEGNIDDHFTIEKYAGPLNELDDTDFKLAIEQLRNWIRSEFKPEELL